MESSDSRFQWRPYYTRRKIGLKVSPVKWARVNGVCLNIYLCGFAKNELTKGQNPIISQVKRSVRFYLLVGKGIALGLLSPFFFYTLFLLQELKITGIIFSILSRVHDLYIMIAMSA